MSVLAYVFHLLEEYYVGGGLPQWFKEILNADLSNIEFLIINGIFMSLVISVAIFTHFGGKTDILLYALGILFFTNGIVHLLASVFTFSYSPGLFSGILIYGPVGFFIFREIPPFLNPKQRSAAIVLGIGVQIIVHVIARNI